MYVTKDAATPLYYLDRPNHLSCTSWQMLRVASTFCRYRCAGRREWLVLNRMSTRCLLRRTYRRGKMQERMADKGESPLIVSGCFYRLDGHSEIGMLMMGESR